MKIADDIFGLNDAALKGKTVHKTPQTVTTDIFVITPEIHFRHNDIIVTADIFFVNKLTFVLSFLEGYTLSTIEYITNRKEDTILKCINKIVKFYNLCNITIRNMYMDREFEVLVNKASALINTTGEDNHVQRIERHIQHVKLRFRGEHRLLPYKFCRTSLGKS